MSKLTVKEYAKLHRVSVQNVYKHIKNGNIKTHIIDNIKYIIIEDKIDYEKKFNDLQLKYDILKEKIEAKEELIYILKEDRKLFSNLIEYKREVEQVTTKKKKKLKEEKKEKKKKKKEKTI